MKLWYDCGNTPRSVNVVSLTETELIIEDGQETKILSPDLIGIVYFKDPYSRPAISKATDYKDSRSYEEAKRDYPDMGQVSKNREKHYQQSIRKPFKYD